YPPEPPEPASAEGRRSVTGGSKKRARRRGRDPVGRLRAICRALPEANEKLSHGEPTWFAGNGKVFAMLDDHHHGAAHLSVWLPQPLGAQGALIEANADPFFRPPHVGPGGRGGVVLDDQPDWTMVAGLVHDAYRLVAGPRLLAELDG